MNDFADPILRNDAEPTTDSGVRTPVLAEITVLTNSRGLLSKRIELLDGKVSKVGDCNMWVGTARRVQIDLGQIATLAAIINGLKATQAYANGRIKDGHPDQVKVVLDRKLADHHGDPAFIARSQDYLVHDAGKPGVLLIDTDLDAMPENTGRRLDERGVWSALCDVVPLLATAARVSRPSTSFGLSNKETGEDYPGSGGWHNAIAVADVADTRRFLAALHARLWLARWGWGKVGGSGAFLERSPADTAVWGPERLTIEGPPVVVLPLVQAPRLAVAYEGAILDTKVACPSLTEAETREFDALKKAERARLEPEMAATRAAWSKTHIQRKVATGMSEADARVAVDRWLDHNELSGDFPLPFDDPKLAGTTVEAVLVNPAKFINQTLADPFESVAYGRGKAILYRRDNGSLFIKSFAHGDARYELKRTPRPDVEAEIERLARLPQFDFDLAKKEAAKRLGISPADLAKAVKSKQRAGQKASGRWPPWFELLRRDERGRVYPDLDNVLIAISGEALLAGAITFDEMRQHSIVSKPWPHVPGGKPGAPTPHETNDDDIARLQRWLQRKGIPRIGREIVGQAVEVEAHDNSFHPLRDQFNALGPTWDGVDRSSKWLFTCLGAEALDDDAIEYVAAIGRMFLISMVARVFQPGCQADYMLVLEGDQGILKSTVCRILAGGSEYFSDSLPEDITSKDARQHLRGKLLVEVSELSAFSKADIEAWKAFISRREEQYRPPYGKHDVAEKRQCVFVGTTNQYVYIKDPTGARRQWPIKCIFIDIEGLAAVRDQLIAEAVVRYKRGEHWWPTPEQERKFFKPQQEKRFEEDPWHPAVATWVETRARDVREGLIPGLGDGRFTVSDVARGCLGFDGESRIGSREQQRIGRILNDLHCPHPPRTMKGRYYLLPPEDGNP